jgi:hypothetical protein
VEALFSSLICMATPSEVCKPLSQATMLQWDLRPQFKAVDRKAKRIAATHVNEKCLVGILASVAVIQKREVSFTLRARKPSPIKALTVSINDEPFGRISLTLKEW